jgi:hypothetical protein
VLAAAGKTFEERPRTTREWCESLNLTAAINAGMFNDDGITHTGYARYRDKVMSTHTNSYQSVAAFDPKSRKDLPPFRIIDLDEPGVTLKSVTSDYASVVQNLRLIKRPGVSMWSHRPNKWCEAALGEDSNGRILFIFSRLPLSMHELNNILLGSGTGILAAQHLEGGPLAQMYLRAGSTELNLSGNPGSQWGIPNVLGLKKRAVEGEESRE